MKLTEIKAHARVHTALINESGYLGRIDGSIGFILEQPYWIICVSDNADPTGLNILNDEQKKSVAHVVQRFNDYLKKEFGVRIKGFIPSHVGLGSKTALLMGLGKALADHNKLNWTTTDIAKFVGRGGTSGIGVYGINGGGFVWDAGRKYPDDKNDFLPSSHSTNEPPKQLVSLRVDGYSVCSFRFDNNTIYGIKELNIFRQHCPLPHEDTMQMLHLVAGSLLPAIVETNDKELQSALNRIQDIGFKKIEWSYQSRRTNAFRSYWQHTCKDVALCLTSMGPTLYCVTLDPTYVKRIVDKFSCRPIDFTITKIKQ